MKLGELWFKDCGKIVDVGKVRKQHWFMV